MHYIEIAEALENGAKGSAIDLKNTHTAPPLKGGCTNTVNMRSMDARVLS